VQEVSEMVELVLGELFEVDEIVLLPMRAIPGR
jgi:hypothetical protein